MPRSACLALALAACELTPAPARLPAKAEAPRDAGSAAVARAPAPDAAAPVLARAPAPAPCPTTGSPLVVGELATPSGWCWRRTEEGDDLSGVLVDAAGAIRMRYVQLAHGARVGDACTAKRPGLRWVKSERAHGIAFRYCEIDATPAAVTCFSFDGRANLCTTADAPQDGFAALDLVRTLRPLR